MHFYVVIKSSQNKENRIAACTHHVHLITNYMYMHKIEQTTNGAISIIRQNSVKCGNCSD